MIICVFERVLVKPDEVVTVKTRPQVRFSLERLVFLDSLTHKFYVESLRIGDERPWPTGFQAAPAKIYSHRSPALPALTFWRPVELGEAVSLTVRNDDVIPREIEAQLQGERA